MQERRKRFPAKIPESRRRRSLVFQKRKTEGFGAQLSNYFPTVPLLRPRRCWRNIVPTARITTGPTDLNPDPCPPPCWKIAAPWILDGCSEFRDGAVNNSLFINPFHSYLRLRRWPIEVTRNVTISYIYLLIYRYGKYNNIYVILLLYTMI